MGRGELIFAGVHPHFSRGAALQATKSGRTSQWGAAGLFPRRRHEAAVREARRQIRVRGAGSRHPRRVYAGGGDGSQPQTSDGKSCPLGAEHRVPERLSLQRRGTRSGGGGNSRLLAVAGGLATVSRRAAMSIDYALWKWQEVPPRITAGLCYVLMAEGVECPEAAPLDIERLKDQIEAAFPDPKALSLTVNFAPSVIFLDTYSSTPTAVVEWFAGL